MNIQSTPASDGANARAADHAGNLARFAEEFRLDAVPAHVVARAKLSLLDSLGIGLASVGRDYADALADALAEIGGPGEFPVLGMGLKLSMRDAAHLNGTLIHGLDFDDTHSGAVVHTSASALPTALAAARATGADGARLLAAFIIASEASSRIGLAAGGGFHEKGYHPTGVVGTFGATLAAGYLFGLDVEGLRDAQGIALSMAAGSMEFLQDGAWSKRQHPGWASVCGLSAVAMARNGFVGPRQPYGGRHGLYALYTPDGREIDWSVIDRELGRRWELTGIAFKPYSACHMTHAFADAVLKIADEHSIGADDVASIHALVAEGEVPVVCEPEESKQRPRNAYEAQFSLPYVMAATLTRGGFGLAELEADATGDPAILDLCRRTTYGLDPDSAYPTYYSGAVEVTTKDGRVLRHREQINRGAEANPVAPSEVYAKFRRNAGLRFGPARVEAILEAVDSLEAMGEVSTLEALVSGAE